MATPALVFTTYNAAFTIAAAATPTVIQTAYTLLATDLASLLVASFVDGENQRSRNFTPSLGAQSSQWNGASGSGYLYGSGTAASVVFPSVSSVTLVTATDTNNVTSTGQIKLVLVPGSGDLFNASSIMTYYLDPSASVTTVTGTF
jgi:hypothetical protein